MTTELMPNLEEVDEIIERYKEKAGPILPVLQDLQQKYNFLPKDALIHVSRRLNMPLSHVFRVATFYTAFSLKPRGKHHISLCLGTACHVRGAHQILDRLEGALKIKAGETTDDLNFSLQTVNCLGACALGPIGVIDGEYHGNLSPAKAEAIVKRIKREASG